MPPKKKSRIVVENPFGPQSSIVGLTDFQQGILHDLYNLRLKNVSSIEEGFGFNKDFLPLEQFYIFSQFNEKLKLSSEALNIYRLRLVRDDQYFEISSPEWVANSIFMSMIDGTLMPAIDIFVDVKVLTEMKPWNEFKLEETLDRDNIIVREISCYGIALLNEVVKKVKMDRCKMVLAVNTHFVCDRGCFSSDKLDIHTTRVDFYYDVDSNEVQANYEDNALSAPRRIEFEKTTLYILGNQKKIFKDGENLPKWAYKQGVVKLSLSDIINIRIYNTMCSILLEQHHISLLHLHFNEMQPWSGIYCAICLLFNFHLLLSDASKSEVLKAFSKHSDIYKSPKAPSGEKDPRWAQKLIMDLYQVFLFLYCKPLLTGGITFSEIYEQYDAGDPLSIGVCSACRQCDTATALMLCEVESCPAAMHVFCMSDPEDARAKWPSLFLTTATTNDDEPPWYCSDHHHQQQQEKHLLH
jgi:hypothetical protein